MVDYTIYQLGEDDLTTSNAQGLDGLDQGSGVHMVGETITINANNWTGINITDNDNNFQDSDSSQVLNGAQAINGVTYPSGTVVEAEYQLTVTDGTNTWTILGFNVNNSSPAFGTVEGIAVLGTTGFPPVGVPLTVVSSSEGPSHAADDYSVPICFVAGTKVATPAGGRRIETIEPGDLVETMDNGPQHVRWVGHKRVAALGRFAPVLIKAGALGNRQDLKVSQQHRMLIRDWRAAYYFGSDYVLATAKHLINKRDVVLCPGGLVTYVHLLFDDHQIIRANGAYAESLHPGRVALTTLDRKARDEVLALFPELASLGHERPLAAPELRRHEALLVA